MRENATKRESHLEPAQLLLSSEWSTMAGTTVCGETGLWSFGDLKQKSRAKSIRQICDVFCFFRLCAFNTGVTALLDACMNE